MNSSTVLLQQKIHLAETILLSNNSYESTENSDAD